MSRRPDRDLALHPNRWFDGTIVDSHFDRFGLRSCIRAAGTFIVLVN